LDLPEERTLKGNGIVRFARCALVWNTREKDDRLRDTLLFRQTSRKKYDQAPDDALVRRLVSIATTSHVRLVKLTAAQAKQAIWLNQRAVFDDMFDEPVRRELDHWLRYSSVEKEAKRDGLSYDCMELNGRLMKYSVTHPRILRAPGIAPVVKRYYLRTMADKSSIFYMLAPFGNEQEAFDVGVTIMKLWKEVAAAGNYLHPFGTIMSNQAAHRDFLRLVRVTKESRDNSYLVFIFRCGMSERPAPSLRLPCYQHLIME
jgi:hypothetical protein